MATEKKSKRVLAVYPIATTLSFLAATLLCAIYMSLFSGDQTGAALGLVIALPLMFLLYSVVYVFVPGSTFVAMYFLNDFVFRDRGTRSTLLSVAIAVGIWVVTFPTALALINVVYAGNTFMMINDSSWAFVSLLSVTNLAGLISAVLWVKLRPAKTK